MADGRADVRRVGYVTTAELAGSAVVRDLLGELRTLRPVAAC
ncbi:hypothetical protein [Nonomuraea typhae]|uniref:Uncharacterized protein n=1 Tax=Nonomuraea typhae TaxID=2603600 RepID=A0ABW7ZAB9_9ACTN